MTDPHLDRLRRKYPVSGAGSAFDVVWRPSAEQAKQEWESAKLVIAPAPSPDGDLGVIDFAAGSITIGVADDTGNDEGPAEAGPS